IVFAADTGEDERSGQRSAGSAFWRGAELILHRELGAFLILGSGADDVDAVDLISDSNLDRNDIGRTDCAEVAADTEAFISERCLQLPIGVDRGLQRWSFCLSARLVG